MLQSTSSEKAMSDESFEAIHQTDRKTLDETVSHDKHLTSKLELEIQGLQKTVTVFLVIL